jgi:hypothetical protein
MFHATPPDHKGTFNGRPSQYHAGSHTGAITPE